MKRIYCIFFLFAALFAFCAAPQLPEQVEPRLPRRLAIGTEPLFEMVKNGKVNFEIVVPADAAPAAKFAGKEASELLSKAFNTKLKVLKKPSGKVPAIILGSPRYAAQLGVDLNKFDRDGFIIKTFPKGVLIIGRDDPEKSERVLSADRATLFGTYDFLERFAGIRFYLPGEYGTIIPSKKNWSLAAIDIYERPDFYQRLYSDWQGNPGSEFKGNARHINKLRNRYQTRNIYHCHALRELNYGTRFGKSHPEYFALQSNGKRVIDTDYTGSSGWDESHFCYNSKIKEEIIADAISYLKGEPASVRGIVTRKRKIGWHWSFPKGGKFFSISPPDGVKKCLCSKCKPELTGTPAQQRDHYWRFFRDVAQAVKDAGVEGYITLPCNYSWWGGMPPEFPIPDNLLLDFSMRGPWNEHLPKARDKQLAELKAWAAKGRGKLLLWTYPGKYYGEFPAIPASTPRYGASFLKRVRPYALGCYFECASDYFFFLYLDKYVYGKILWNPDTDVEKLLEEHAQLMFGPAAKFMKEFFDSVERNWMKLAGHSVNTNIGPITMYPSEQEMWATVYSPAERERINTLFAQAEKVTANIPEYLKKVRTLRREMWLPVLRQAEKFSSSERAIANWSALMTETETPPVIDGKLNDKVWKKAECITLIPGRKNTPCEVRTTVRTLRDKEYFYFAFEAEDRKSPDSVPRPRDSQDLWRDAGVEIFLSPDKSLERCYQIMVNASGSVADLVRNKKVNDWKWESRAEVKTAITPGKGWTTEIRIPRNALVQASGDGMLANFTRRYMPAGKKSFSYVWGPFIRNHNNEIEHFGTLRFTEEKEKNLIKDGNFAREIGKSSSRFFGVWSWHGKEKKFPAVSDWLLSGRYSALLDSERFEKDVCSIVQNPPLKPGTEYSLTFFVKMEKVKPAGASSSGFYVRVDDLSRKEQCFPNRHTAALSGTLHWTPMEFRFKTSATVLPNRRPRVSFILRKATGKVWIDNVKLVEIKK